MTEIAEIDGLKYLIKNRDDLIQKNLLSGLQWNNDIILLLIRIQKNTIFSIVLILDVILVH